MSSVLPKEVYDLYDHLATGHLPGFSTVDLVFPVQSTKYLRVRQTSYFYCM